MIHRMKITTVVLALLAVSGMGSAEVRKWTSADDASKTFEGELSSTKGDNVVVRMANGRTVTVPLSKLSQADRDFVAGVAKGKTAAADEAAAAEKAKTGAVAKALSGNTVKLDGKKFKKCDVFAAKAPEYYLVYWGASWCGPCRATAPKLAEAYDETISKAKNIEVIHLSCDQDENGMASFVEDMKFNFPAVARAKWEKEKLFSQMAPKAIPHYKLLDAAGNVVARDEEAKDKAKEIAHAAEGKPADEKKGEDKKSE